MRRDQLCAELRREYTADLKSGVCRATDERYRNTWFVRPPAPPRIIQSGCDVRLLAKANEILMGRTRLKDIDRIGRVMSYLFARREALTSSRMEGTWSTLDEVLTPPSEADDRDIKRSASASVRGYANAISHGLLSVENVGVAAFDVSLARKLHEAIMSKDPMFTGKAGALRAPDHPRGIVFIGGNGKVENSIFNPPPPEFVSECLEETLAWYRDDILAAMGHVGQGPSLIMRMAIGHAHFEAVHPFSDGNGRVGRILLVLHMAAEGIVPLYLSDYIEANKEQYYGALQDAQKQLSYGPLTNYIAEAVIACEGEEHKTREALQLLPELWKGRVKPRAKSTAERALDILVEFPIVTPNLLQEQLNCSYPAANNAIAALVKNGVLRQRNTNKRNRIYAAEEVLAVLAREYGTSAQDAIAEARDLLESGDN